MPILFLRSHCMPKKKIFKIKPTKINRVIQKFFLVAIIIAGIHLIILGRDEFDDNFRPVSFRLRFMTKLVGRNLFLHEMRRNHHLLYGKNLFDEIRIEHPGFSEKLACFLFPSIILLFLLPTLLFSRRTFKIWWFKAIKYHNISLRAYAKIAGLEYVFNDTLFNTAKIFRYKPDEYLNNPIILYTQAYRHTLWKSVFLWKT